MLKTYTPTSTRPKLRYWAVRVGDFIEFRVWSKQPIKMISKLTKKTIVEKRRYEYLSDGQVKWRLEPVEVKNVISQVVYVGGKVLGMVKAKDVEYMLHVPPNGRVETTKAVKDAILKGFKNW